MATETLLRRGLYRDSVTLMRLAATLEARPGIARASVVMASPANLTMLAENGVSVGRIEAGANYLLVAVEGACEVRDISVGYVGQGLGLVRWQTERLPDYNSLAWTPNPTPSWLFYSRKSAIWTVIGDVNVAQGTTWL